MKTNKEIKKQSSEVNSLWKNVKTSYKEEFNKGYTEYVRTHPSAEKDRDNEINGSFLLKWVKPVVVITALVTLISLGCMLWFQEIAFLIVYFIAVAILFIFAIAQEKFTKKKSEKRRTKELIEVRRKAWNRAIEANCAGKYSTDLYIKLLLCYHKNSFWHRIVVFVISSAFVIFVVWLTKDVDSKETVNLIMLFFINVFANVCGGYLNKNIEEEFLFETLKYDMVIE